MSISTYEATIEDGQIHLPADVVIPKGSRVFVVVAEEPQRPLIRSPRLKNAADAKDFLKTVVKDSHDASV